MDYILSGLDFREYTKLPFTEHYVFQTLNALEGGARSHGRMAELIGSLAEDFFPVVGGTL